MVNQHGPERLAIDPLRVKALIGWLKVQNTGVYVCSDGVKWLDGYIEAGRAIRYTDVNHPLAQGQTYLWWFLTHMTFLSGAFRLAMLKIGLDTVALQDFLRDDNGTGWNAMVEAINEMYKNVALDRLDSL